MVYQVLFNDFRSVYFKLKFLFLIIIDIKKGLLRFFEKNLIKTLLWLE